MLDDPRLSLGINSGKCDPSSPAAASASRRTSSATKCSPGSWTRPTSGSARAAGSSSATTPTPAQGSRRARDDRGAERARRRGSHDRRHRRRHLRHDDAELLLPRQRPGAAGEDGLPRTMPTFDIRQQCSRLPLRPRPRRLADPQRQVQAHAARRRRRAHAVHAVAERMGHHHRPRGPRGHAGGVRARTPRIRDRTVLFGDGAGAVVDRGERERRRAASSRRSSSRDGSNIEALYVPGVGFRTPPVHRPRPDRPRRSDPGDGRPRRLQGGRVAHARSRPRRLRRGGRRR